MSINHNIETIEDVPIVDLAKFMNQDIENPEV
jgi:hypothetical protein